MNEPLNVAGAPAVAVQRVVRCPSCGEEHWKALYDWQYIYCNKCKTYFEKHTGKKINHDGTPQGLPEFYWRKDT